MDNYFRNENVKISKVQKNVEELNTNIKSLIQLILIVKLKYTFTYLQLINMSLDCEDFLFLKC